MTRPGFERIVATSMHAAISGGALCMTIPGPFVVAQRLRDAMRITNHQRGHSLRQGQQQQR